ncbi:MAG: universal stress protein [Burkholderiales bacterium]|nr:universal stress protein [Burkholderiales bacterium]
MRCSPGAADSRSPTSRSRFSPQARCCASPARCAGANHDEPRKPETVTTTQIAPATRSVAEAALYGRILVALDSSDHSNRALEEAIGLAALCGARMTGTHVYAARLHDLRFRQMEGGLPEPFREERELERQREVHDDLITRGLSIITDSYLDQAERACARAAVAFARRPLEGKNYRALAEEANGGGHDLLVIGALGLGAIAGNRLGSVCARVARRAEIDTLVIKAPQRSLSEGPIVVAVDGSPRAYGGLRTALALAARWRAPVKVVAAYDPYYHYVAFHRIAGVLSEEAGKVFRFKEQEKLHEEIIDAGLARIYQGHLAVAESIAGEAGVAIETMLLAGKPHDAIGRYAHEANAALLVVGKLGVHADAGLDIGGNAERLLHDVDCAVLLSQRAYEPPVDVLAEATTSWTREAEARMERVPSFARGMARMAILRYAQEKGHTVVTERIVEEATAALMPAHAERMMGELVAHAAQRTPAPADAPMQWSREARALLDAVADAAVRDNLRLRAEKRARRERSPRVEAAHTRTFVAANAGADAAAAAADPGAPRPHWTAAALARLARVPEGFMREAARERIERHARAQGGGEITAEVAEAGLAQAREAMAAAAGAGRSAPAADGAARPQESARSRACSRSRAAARPASGDPVWVGEAGGVPGARAGGFLPRHDAPRGRDDRAAARPRRDRRRVRRGDPADLRSGRARGRRVDAVG